MLTGSEGCLIPATASTLTWPFEELDAHTCLRDELFVTDPVIPEMPEEKSHQKPSLNT
jgi:hypothetical protein